MCGTDGRQSYLGGLVVSESEMDHVNSFDTDGVQFGGAGDEQKRQRRENILTRSPWTKWSEDASVAVIGLRLSLVVKLTDCDRDRFEQTCLKLLPGSSVKTERVPPETVGRTLGGYVVAVVLAAPCVKGRLASLVCGLLEALALEGSLDQVVFIQSGVCRAFPRTVLSQWQEWLSCRGVQEREALVDLLRDALGLGAASYLPKWAHFSVVTETDWEQCLHRREGSREGSCMGTLKSEQLCISSL